VDDGAGAVRNGQGCSLSDGVSFGTLGNQGCRGAVHRVNVCSHRCHRCLIPVTPGVPCSDEAQGGKKRLEAEGLHPDAKLQLAVVVRVDNESGG